MDGVRFEPLTKLIGKKLKTRVPAGRLQLTFPYDQHVPAQSLKTGDIIRITLLIPTDFFRPKLRIGFRQSRIAAKRMAMPEAAVDENHRVVFSKHNVRPSRKVAPMQRIAKPAAVQEPAHNKLGARVHTPNPRHAVMPLLFCHPVRHVVLLRGKVRQIILRIGFISYICNGLWYGFERHSTELILQGIRFNGCPVCYRTCG